MAIVFCWAFETDLTVSALVVMALGQGISTSAAVNAVTFVMHALNWLLCHIQRAPQETPAPQERTQCSTNNATGGLQQPLVCPSFACKVPMAKQPFDCHDPFEPLESSAHDKMLQLQDEVNWWRRRAMETRDELFKAENVITQAFDYSIKLEKDLDLWRRRAVETRDDLLKAEDEITQAFHHSMKLEKDLDAARASLQDVDLWRRRAMQVREDLFKAEDKITQAFNYSIKLQKDLDAARASLQDVDLWRRRAMETRDDLLKANEKIVKLTLAKERTESQLRSLEELNVELEAELKHTLDKDSLATTTRDPIVEPLASSTQLATTTEPKSSTSLNILLDFQALEPVGSQRTQIQLDQDNDPTIHCHIQRAPQECIHEREPNTATTVSICSRCKHRLSSSPSRICNRGTCRRGKFQLW